MFFIFKTEKAPFQSIQQRDAVLMYLHCLGLGREAGSLLPLLLILSLLTRYL